MFSLFLATIMGLPVAEASSGSPLEGAPPDTIRTQRLDEVVVTRNHAATRLESVQMGTEHLGVKELGTAPALLGERDVMRSMQLLPGVKQESEASSGFQVRGGTSAQNTILFDHMPVYNVSHLAGLFSAFNDDVLSGATLYKGCPPARYGGATSGVLDIASRPGTTDRWHGGATIGLLSAKVRAEGPLGGAGNDRGPTLLVAARRSYADVALKLSDEFKDNTLYFYDANARMDWSPGERDQLQLSLFGSRDRTALSDLLDMQWTNVAASLSWRHYWRGGARSETQLLLSDYSTRSGFDLLGLDLSFSGYIRQRGLRHELFATLGRQQLNIGFQSALVDVKSAEWQSMNNHERERRKAWDASIWAGADLRLARWLQAQAGIRLTSFASLGGPHYYETDSQGNIVWYYLTREGRIVNTHISPEPRLSLLWKASPQLSIKGAYARTVQNIHALRGQATATPFDRYTLSSNLVRPARADQLSLGAYAATADQSLDFSAEGYFRNIANVLDYRDGKSFSSAIEMERLVLPGKGRCYGMELMARKNTGRLTGWLAYTLSWARNKIDGINGGRWYAATGDRRHDVNAVAVWKLSETWTLSGTWVYTSGQAFTAPSAKYEVIDNYVYYYAERNGYRAPAYHRLDVSATWSRSVANGRLTREWQFGIYNLYNRYNPYLINFEDSEHGARTKATAICLLGIVPSVSLALKF